MLDCLIMMRRDGHDYISCADAIGVSHTVVSKKCQELGINHKMNNGPVAGVVRRKRSK